MGSVHLDPGRLEPGRLDPGRLGPERLVLENVPQVAFYGGGKRCPEDICWPSALRAALEYLGDPQVGCNACRTHAADGDMHLGCSYALHLVTSGLAFQQLWRPGDWEYADDVPRMTPEPLGPYRHALEAMGYSFEVLANPATTNPLALQSALAPAGDEAAFRSRIAESLRAGRPVVALGVVGPPESGLVAGYDEGGDVLIGWSFFQGFPEMNDGVAFEPNGQYRVRNWYPKTAAIITLGERGERPPLKDTLRAAYRRAVALVRTEVCTATGAGWRRSRPGPRPWRTTRTGPRTRPCAGRATIGIRPRWATWPRGAGMRRSPSRRTPWPVTRSPRPNNSWRRPPAMPGCTG